MNVKEIVLDYLLKNKYEGLFNEGSECGCLIDDFMPCCDGLCVDCQPGYKLPGDEECDFLVGPEQFKKEV